MTTLDGTWTYSYDAIGQLTGAVFAPVGRLVDPAQSLSYIYNAAGDRTQTVINGVTYITRAIPTTSTRPSPRRPARRATPTTPTATWSPRPTRAARPPTTYNSLNQLVSVTSPTGSWQFEYDALGDLVSTTENGQMTDNLVDPTGAGDVVGQYEAG